MAPELLLTKLYSKVNFNFIKFSIYKPVDLWSCGITMYLLLHKGKHPFFSKYDKP